ncbi:hypothetical protein [Micromonospora chersina]|uniref:hypothetical protein n=1 Tax=Micromonospora chersina TaxID=47854 RepID=UPI00340669CD
MATIDLQAPPSRRALARYLCVYAEFAGFSPTELASRADIATTVTMDILAGRLVPTLAHRNRLADVPDCEPDTLRHLTTAASSATALDESFWTIAGSIDTLTPPEGRRALSEVVGSDPDNRAPDTFTDPTSPPNSLRARASTVTEAPAPPAPTTAYRAAYHNHAQVPER